MRAYLAPTSSDGHDTGTIPGQRCKVAVLPSRPTTVGFRAPASSAIRPMHDADTNITLQQLRIYDGDELIFDGSDPSTYTVCQTAEQLEAALAAAGAAKQDR
jgi:hypothetical protein